MARFSCQVCGDVGTIWVGPRDGGEVVDCPSCAAGDDREDG